MISYKYIINFLKSPKILILFFSFFIFLLLFPLSNLINFYQNDDWVYYKAISQFLNGNYQMPGYIEALFYTQGFLGTLFAKIFGLSKLPILTLLLACATYFIFTFTIFKFYLHKVGQSILIGLLFFVSPLYIYSTLGFMSEIYFVFFLTLSFYFYEELKHKSSNLNFFLFNLSMIVGFFVRQFSIFAGFVAVVIFVKDKKYKFAGVQALIDILLYLSYQYLVPKTGTMVKHGVLNFTNLLDPSFVFTTTYIGLIYATIFLIPLIIILTKQNLSIEKSKILKFLSYLIFVVGIFVSIGYFFDNEYADNSDVFYLKNTVNNNGFFYGNSFGEKYHFYNETGFYYYLELLAKISVAFFLASILFNYKKLLNFYFLFAVLYLGFMLILEGGLYDRYYLPLIPVTILFILSLISKINNFDLALISTFISLTIFFSYNFAMDFVILNKLLWDTGNKLNYELNVPKELIAAGNGWNRTYQNKDLRYKYMFYFQTREYNKDISCCFKLYDTFEIFYPFNMFKDSKIYLYKRFN